MSIELCPSFLSEKSTPAMPHHPRPTPKASKTYASEAKKRKTESVLPPPIPAKTYGKKNRNSTTAANEPLSTCVFDYEEAESLVGTYR